MILSHRNTIQLNRPIIVQPIQIDNVFAITPEEEMRQIYECDTKVCGCGSTYTVTLTNARIIQRFQDYVCGCKANHVDSMLFLSDISNIKSTGERRCCDPCTATCASCLLVLFFPIELLCCFWRCLFSKDIPIPIALNGAFGKEVFIFSHHAVSSALADIPAAALPHKISSRTPSNRMS
jgi:hypothetical protein